MEDIGSKKAKSMHKEGVSASSNALSGQVQSWRQHFPMLCETKEPFVYLDSAATTLKPQSVIDCIHEFYSSSYATVNRSVYRTASLATERYHQVRENVARFIGAQRAEEIVFTKGCTESLNLLASCLGKELKEGDEIVISSLEHHANILPWQLLAQQKKLILKVIHLKWDSSSTVLGLDLDHYKSLLSHKTKVVAVSHVSNVLGIRQDVELIAKLAHEVGAVCVVDGAQAAATVPIDLKKSFVDFYTFSAHKTYGPTGVGVLYGKWDQLMKLPPYQGGGDMITKVSFQESSYQEPPLRFEAGTPNIAGVLGLGAALDFIRSIGQEAISAHELSLARYAYEKLSAQFPCKFLCADLPQKGILSFSLEGVHPLDLASLLDFDGIAIRSGHHCAQPLLSLFSLESCARMSFGIYNHFEEIDYFLIKFGEIIKKIRM